MKYIVLCTSDSVCWSVQCSVNQSKVRWPVWLVHFMCVNYIYHLYHLCTFHVCQLYLPSMYISCVSITSTICTFHVCQLHLPYMTMVCSLCFLCYTVSYHNYNFVWPLYTQDKTGWACIIKTFLKYLLAYKALNAFRTYSLECITASFKGILF